MNVFVCITTRDGKPDFDVVQAAQASCDYFRGSSRLGTTANAHNVCVSRNQGVAKMRAAGFSHILFVDNDVRLPLDALDKLARVDAPVVTGCVPTTVGGRPFITVAQSVDSETNAVTWQRQWFDGVRDTEVCGGACLLVRADVFDAVGFPWFRWPERLEDGEHHFFSEDVDFCNRVMAAGLGPIRAHGEVRCGHERRIDVSGLIEFETDATSAFDEMRAARPVPVAP